VGISDTIAEFFRGGVSRAPPPTPAPPRPGQQVERIRDVACDLAITDNKHDVEVVFEGDQVISIGGCNWKAADSAERLGAKTCARLLREILDVLAGSGAGASAWQNDRIQWHGESLDRTQEALDRVRKALERVAAGADAKREKRAAYKRPVWARRELLRKLLGEHLTRKLGYPVEVGANDIVLHDETQSRYLLMRDNNRPSWALGGGPGDVRLLASGALRTYTQLLTTNGILDY
jgi:hypothetical protein